jgi:VWFA-related protein
MLLTGRLRAAIPAAGLLLCLATLQAWGADPAACGARDPAYSEYLRVVDRPWQRIGMTVTVTDRQGRPVKDLARGEFRVSEDGAPVELTEFGSEGARGDRPLSVAVLLDLSQSMRAQVSRVKEAAQALLRGLRPGDEIMVAKFNDQLTVLQGFTADPGAPEGTLADVGQAWGGTALFRALERTLKDLRERPGRKVILVVSDGLDNDVARDQHVLMSLYLQDLLRLCLRTQTTVYGIRPGMAATSWLPFEGFVEETGGRLLYTGGDLERLFARLGEEFQSQYYVAYDIDPKAREGKRRRIRVEVTRPDVVVRAMGGYFTPRSHLRTLIGDLLDEDADLRADAAFELGFVSTPDATRALLRALDDPDERVRRLAVESLARLGEAPAAPRLVALLGDAAEPVRAAAGGALLMFGAASIPALASEVAEGAGHRKARPRLLEGAGLLGRVGDERAIDPLAALLERGPAEARVVAARSLGELGLSQGIPPLRTALADPAPEVRGAALRSIVAIAGAGARPLVEDYLRRETDPALRSAARAALDSP